MRNPRNSTILNAIYLVLELQCLSCKEYISNISLYGYNPFKSADCKQTLKRNVKAFFEIPNSKYPT